MRTARLAEQKIPLSGKPPARQMAMPDESVTVRFEHPSDCLRLGWGAPCLTLFGNHDPEGSSWASGQVATRAAGRL
ncbi:MAG: hypothetical protein ACYCTF_03370 [Acidiferrobacter sp.]